MYDPRISALALQDPEAAAIERRRMLAAMLMQQGQQNQKLTHPLQVVGNLANTAVSALLMRKADEEGKALTDQWRSQDDAHWNRALGRPEQGAAPAGPAGPMTAPPPDPVQRENVPPLAGSTLSVPEHLRPIIQQASDQSGVPFNILAAKLQQRRVDALLAGLPKVTGDSGLDARNALEAEAAALRRWAVALCSSRPFTLPYESAREDDEESSAAQQQLAAFVPFIDMANHDAEPNCYVQVMAPDEPLMNPD